MTGDELIEKLQALPSEKRKNPVGIFGPEGDIFYEFENIAEENIFGEDGDEEVIVFV